MYVAPNTRTPGLKARTKALRAQHIASQTAREAQDERARAARNVAAIMSVMSGK